MFVDEVSIRVRAGRGGDGCVSFRREKHVPRGGPDGGNGGRGGSILLVGDARLSTLVDYRFKREYRAASGTPGAGNNRSGRNGPDIELRVPIGTLVRDRETGEPVADIVTDGQRACVAAGGRGGRGNASFVSSTHQVPRHCERGEPAQERSLTLELKLLADVGLVGFPNVGKSTLLSRVSAARPKVADYPFTTLAPCLGVVSLEPGKSFVMADIPGLIAGASLGAGLGHQFLRHVERTRILIHVLDISGTSMRDPLEDYRIVNRELASHDPRLADLPQLVALNKSDLLPGSERPEALEATLREEGRRVFLISAVSGAGVDGLLRAAGQLLDELPLPLPALHGEVAEFRPAEASTWEVAREDGQLVVRGAELERLVAMTDLSSDVAVRHLHRRLERMGVVRALRDQGAVHGSDVRIGSIEFEFVD